MIVQIPVNQQTGKCGDEFLSELDFTIEFEVDYRPGDWIKCKIDQMEDCYIKRCDLLVLLDVLRHTQRNGNA